MIDYALKVTWLLPFSQATHDHSSSLQPESLITKNLL
jgi:hypothetical protein